MHRPGHPRRLPQASRPLARSTAFVRGGLCVAALGTLFALAGATTAAARPVPATGHSTAHTSSPSGGVTIGNCGATGSTFGVPNVRDCTSWQNLHGVATHFDCRGFMFWRQCSWDPENSCTIADRHGNCAGDPQGYVPLWFYDTGRFHIQSSHPQWEVNAPGTSEHYEASAIWTVTGLDDANVEAIYADVSNCNINRSSSLTGGTQALTPNGHNGAVPISVGSYCDASTPTLLGDIKPVGGAVTVKLAWSVGWAPNYSWNPVTAPTWIEIRRAASPTSSTIHTPAWRPSTASTPPRRPSTPYATLGRQRIS